MRSLGRLVVLEGGEDGRTGGMVRRLGPVDHGMVEHNHRQEVLVGVGQLDLLHRVLGAGAGE